MNRTMTIETLHRITVHDYKDARAALNADEPHDPDDFTPDAITTLLSEIRACEGYLLTMQRLAEHRATCQPCPTYTDATRRAAQEAIEQRMRNDIGPAGWEFWWERS